MTIMVRTAVLVVEAGRLSGEADRLWLATTNREVSDAIRHARNAFDLAEHCAADAVEAASREVAPAGDGREGTR